MNGPAERLLRRRPLWRVESMVLLTAMFLMVAANGSFWHAALAGRSWGELATWRMAAAMFVAFSAFYFAFGAVLANRYTVKPLLSVLLLGSAAASYYMDHYGVYLDRTMLRNVLATDYQEARELLGWGLVGHLMLFGALPALVLVWWPTVRRSPPARALVVRAIWIVLAVGLGAGSLMLVFADFASLMRNHHEVRYLITPGNIVASLTRNAWHRPDRAGAPKLPVAPDAKLAASWRARTRPTLFVLVVGETARAQNFSLNGYPRETNPELARRAVIDFPHAQACGTSTEVSLPCMFSPFGRRQYDEDRILSHESLLQVLARAGFQVLWRDNQSGCKGVCDDRTQERLDHAGVAGLCAGGQCMDEVLLHGMDQIVRDTKGNLFVVLHQLGSHGPAYFKRYPDAFKRFIPACESEDLRLCSQAQIVNAYDNSLLYTDFVLGRVIDFLDRAQQTHDTAMIYVSDHGESLGDSGLYLHGVPYAVAPEVQKNVPLVMWLSPAFQRDFGIEEACLRHRAGLPASHDNLFHSVLGVLDVQTSAYDAALDLFAPCRVMAPVQAQRLSPQTAH